MTNKATKQLNKIKEHEFQSHESNAFKTAQANSDTSTSDEEFNKSGTKELNLIPNTLSNSPIRNGSGVDIVDTKVGLDSEDEPFQPSDKGT